MFAGIMTGIINHTRGTKNDVSMQNRANFTSRAKVMRQSTGMIHENEIIA